MPAGLKMEPWKNHTFVGSYKLPLCQYTCIGIVVACSFQHHQNNTNNCRNNVQNDKHYFEVYSNDYDDVYAYIYIPLNKVKRCVCLEMLYRTSGDIYNLWLLLLHNPSRGDKDNLRSIPVRGGSKPLVCASYQQSAIAHGIVDSIDDVRSTFDDMCEFGMAAQCRSNFVVLTLHGYETHAIIDNYQQRSFMYMDYIQFHNAQTIKMLRC
jgi:hypothetical protein